MIAVPPAPSAPPDRSALDTWAATALFVTAVTIGSAYVRVFDRSGARAITDFGQPEFGAAVALACGHGFIDPKPSAIPALKAFLALETDRFACSELPQTLPPQRPNLTQGLYRYLMTTVALIWAERGVSWSGLWPLFGFAYGATIAICYALFRLAAGRALSCAAAVAVMVSATHLGFLPFLRDYAKAPFILGLVLIMGHLAARSTRRRPLVQLSALFGVVLGVGFGFRNDLLIAAPPFVVVLLLWEPPRDWAGLRQRLGCLAVAAAAFAIVGWPILSAYSRGSNSGHVAFLGLMTNFNQPLRIAGSIYEWGYVYLDAFADTVINSYSERIAGHPVAYLSREYDQAMMEYLMQIARHWPADMIVRAYAATLRVLELPYAAGAYTSGVPKGIENAFVVHAYEWQQAALRLLQGIGITAAALALLLSSASSIRAAVLLLIGLVYFAGYPAIQFQVRHFFHLEFIAWWALAFVVQRLGSIVSTRTMPPIRPMAAFAAAALLILGAPLAIARQYQAAHLHAFLRAYADAPLEAVSIAPEPAGGRTLLRAVDLWNRRDPRETVSTEYVVAEIDPARCTALWLPTTFRYEAAFESSDLSLDVGVPLQGGQGPTRIMFPAYAQHRCRFAGIEVPRGYEGCVTRLSRVADLGPLPLLINLTLRPHWADGALYQTLDGWESRPAVERTPTEVRARPWSAPVDADVLSARLDPLPPVPFRARIVRADASGIWRIAGTPDGPATYVVRISPEPRGPGDRFVVSGEVIRGGLTVGLMRGEEWDGGSVTIAAKGPFVAVLAPRARAEYGVVLANALEDSWMLRHAGDRLNRLVGLFHTYTDVSIARAGWIRSAASASSW